MISVITTGRDDNYGKHFVESMKLSLSNTITLLESEGMDYEVIVVDWSPIERELKDNEKLSCLQKNAKVKFHVVSPTKVQNKGLNPKNFYEYFAKNAGVRKSNFEWLLIHNPDILLSKGLVNNICSIVKTSSVSENKFYRFNKRIYTNLKNAELGTWEKDYCIDLRNPKNKDDHVLGAYGGDVLFLPRRVFFEFGKGYNESDIQHKHQNFRQTAMDSEILINMHINGATMSLIQDHYGHIEHEYPAKRSGNCNMRGYKNVETWGDW